MKTNKRLPENFKSGVKKKMPIFFICAFLFFYFSGRSFVSAVCPDQQPVIIGPLAICNLEGTSATYYANFAGSNFTWSCVGGTISSPNTNPVVVDWGSGYSVYSLTITLNDECQTTIFLNDCECKVPTGANEIIDLNDLNFMISPGVPDLNAIATAIHPTNASSNGSYITVSNCTLFIRGIFNMTAANIYFRDCQIYMDKGSVIYTPMTIANGIGMTFEKSIIEAACKFMWQGINVSADGHLQIIKNSRLSDAEFGITLDSKMIVDLIDSKFSRNYVTVYARPDRAHNAWLGIVENCDFDGSQALLQGHYLLQNFVGQYPPNGQHPLPQNDKCFTAFELHNLVPHMFMPIFPTIPFSLVPSTINTFHDYNMAIFGHNSILDVYNCKFRKIFSVGVYNFYGNYNGSAIYTDDFGTLPMTNYTQIGDFDTQTEAKTNYFNSVYRSILLQGTLDSDVLNNQIDDNTHIAIEIRRSDAHYTHNVNFNNINNTTYGILSNLNLHSTMNINSNFINTYQSANPQMWGIAISDAVGSACMADVNNNVISSYGTIGIYGRNNQNSTYQHNAVSMNNTLLPHGTRDIYGFQILNSNKNTFFCNHAECQWWPINSFLNFESRAYYFNDSPDNTVSCNVANQMRYGFEFYRNCSSSQTSFYGNSMWDLYDGLLLGDYNGGAVSTWGFQQLVQPNNVNTPGNIWLGYDNNGTFHHAATMTVNSNPPFHSLWVNSGLNNPLVNLTSGGTAFTPFVTNIDPFRCVDCGGGGNGEGGGESGIHGGKGDVNSVETLAPENTTGALDANPNYEASRSIIDQIKNKTILNGRWEFTKSEWSTIISLAYSCPLVNGPAVYDAQSLAIYVDPSLYFNETDQCKSFNRISNAQEIFATMSPNPANTHLSITTSLPEIGNGELHIFNSLGSKVFSIHVAAKEDLADIDIQSLTSGIYTCRLIMNNADYLLGKLSVVK